MRLILFILGLGFSLHAQDTVYFNKLGKWAIKDSANYYRTIKKNNEVDYDVKFFYMNGIKKMEGHYRYLNPEFKIGRFTYYSEDGKLTAVKHFNSQENGKSTYYYPNGNIRLIRNFDQGKEIDTTFTYYETGELKRIQTYSENGRVAKGKVFTKSGADTTFYPYEERLSIKMNSDEFYEFWYQHLIYPKEAKKDGFRGKVKFICIVSESGELEEATAYETSHKFLNESALEFLKKIPAWCPARFDGVPLKSSGTIEIPFKFR